MARSFRKFNLFDALCWKVLPDSLGCGNAHLQTFKHAWIIHNKEIIKSAAIANNIPSFLLAGVAFIEVGGKDFTDWPVFIIRSLDWSGPAWVDSKLTTFKNPSHTSMGAVSIQLRRAAEALGVNISTFNQKQLNYLAFALQSDTNNLIIVAKHLKQLLAIDFPNKRQTNILTNDQVRIVGTRYYYGSQKSQKAIKRLASKPGSYGSVIIKHKPTILNLLR